MSGDNMFGSNGTWYFIMTMFFAGLTTSVVLIIRGIYWLFSHLEWVA